MTFRTKLDYSDNRQIKQRERTSTILSGTTVFGVPFSALTSGPDMGVTAQTSQYFSVISSYSGNSATTVFTWSIPNVSAIDSSISALTPTNSGVSQNINAVFGSSSTTIIDGNLINLTYSGVGATNLYPITMSELTPGNYTGTISTDFFIYSAQTLDFTGRTIWIDNTEILRTKKLIVSENSTPGYVLTSDSEGLATWQYNGSSSGSTIWTAGTGTGSAVLGGSGGYAGAYSVAAGLGVSATTNYSFAEGFFTIADGSRSHAEGSQTFAYGGASHAEGAYTIASGSSSHAEGELTTASGDRSHAEGYTTVASGINSHAEGDNTIASGDTSHAQGIGTIAGGQYSHAEGYDTRAYGDYGSHAEGYQTISQGQTSHAEGYLTKASGDGSHAEGGSLISLISGGTASGNGSHAEGYNTLASGQASHAEGVLTSATTFYAHAEGQSTLASGTASHAEGYQVTASGVYSHAEGYYTTAKGDYSHAEGYQSIASGQTSHASGQGTKAIGDISFVHGVNSVALANYTIVLGRAITGSTADTTYVDSFNIKTVGSSAFINDIRIDANGNLTTNTSDERFKENIEPLKNSLNIIKELNGVTYQWKDRNAGGDDVKIGFIAQQVQKVDSRLVFTNKVDEYLGIHVDNIIPLLVEAVKELSSGITTSNNTHLETQTILAEDNNIELNYNGNKTSAIGGGISIINGLGDGINADFKLNNDGSWVTNNPLSPSSLVIPEYTPSNSYDNYGKNGDVTKDENYLYIKSINKWKRVRLEEF